VGMASEERPWGSCRVIDVSDGYKDQADARNPGCRLSLQTPEHRSEHWVVIQGRAVTAVDDRDVTVYPRELIDELQLRATPASTTPSALRTTAAADPTSQCRRRVEIRTSGYWPSSPMSIANIANSVHSSHFAVGSSAGRSREITEIPYIDSALGVLRGARDLAGATCSRLPPDDL